MKKNYLALLAVCVLSLFSADLKALNNESNMLNESTVFVQDEMQTVDEDSASFTQEVKKRFIEGGPSFMGIVMLCLILGLAIAIERIIYLNLATTNSKKLIEGVDLLYLLVVLMRQKNYVETQEDLLHQYSTRDLTEQMKELKVLKKLLFLMVGFKWDN